MIVYRAIVWVEKREDWEKNETETGVGIFVSNDTRIVAASKVKLLLQRVEKAASEIPTCKHEDFRLSYTKTISKSVAPKPPK